MESPFVMARPRRNDDGMTVFEVVIAASILLFALMALLGLLGVSSTMTARAKTQTVAVNAANSVVEKIRAESFPTLSQTGVDSICATSSGAVGNVNTVITGVLTPERTAGVSQTDPPSYYKLEVTVVATGIGSPVTFTTSTYIRRWRMESDPTRVKPTVAFTSSSPVQSDIVWGDRQVGATANSNMPSVSLVRLGVYGKGTPIVETSASPWAVNGTWHTTDWSDGDVALTAEARDGLQLAISSRTVVVDNLAPSSYPTPTLSAVTSTNTVIWKWDAVQDGDVAVNQYIFKVWKQSSTSSAFALDGAALTLTPSVSNGLQTHTILTTSFSRYYVSVRGCGPREIKYGAPGSGLGHEGTSGIYVSRPSAGGSTCTIVDAGKSNSKASFKAVLKTDSPTFANTSSDGTYHWQYKYGSQAWAYVDPAGIYTGNNPYTTATITAPVNGKISDNPIEFRCLVNITPSGGSATYVPSSMVTFTGSAVGAATLSSDSWAKWDTTSVHNHTINWSSWSL